MGVRAKSRGEAETGASVTVGLEAELEAVVVFVSESTSVGLSHGGGGGLGVRLSARGWRARRHTGELKLCFNMSKVVVHGGSVRGKAILCGHSRELGEVGLVVQLGLVADGDSDSLFKNHEGIGLMDSESGFTGRCGTLEELDQAGHSLPVPRCALCVVFESVVWVLKWL